MRKEFVFVCISLFLLLFGANLSGMLLVPYARELGGTSLWIGIIYSSMYVVRLVLGTPVGRLSQSKGPKKMLTYSLAFYPFLAVAYFISWNIPSLLGARLLHGVASVMMLPMAMAYMGEISPAGQEGRYMGIYNTILYFAQATGPLAGGLIYDYYGIRAGFLSLFVLAVFAFLIMILFSGDKSRAVSGRTPVKEMPAGDMKPAGGKLLKNRKLLALSSIYISASVLMALLGASFTQLTLSYGLGMGLIGLLSALNNVATGAVQIPFGRFSDRFDKFRLTVVSGVAISILVVLLPMVRNSLGIAAMITVLGVFSALSLAAVSALSAILGKEAGMGSTMGFLGSVNSAGTIIGYLALGWISDNFGIGSAFTFTGTVFLAGIILFFILWSRSTGPADPASFPH